MRASFGIFIAMLSAAQASGWVAEEQLPPAPVTSEHQGCIVETRLAAPEDYFPPGAIRRVESGEVVIEFSARIGSRRVEDVTIVKGSGFEDLDRAALKLGQALEASTLCDPQRVRRSIVFDAYRDPRDKPESHGCVMFNYVTTTVSIFPVEAEEE